MPFNMGSLRNISCVFYQRFISHGGYMKVPIWQHARYKKDQSLIYGAVVKNGFVTSSYLQNEKNIVSSFCKKVDIPTNVTLHEFIWKSNVKNHGDKIALIDGITGESYTYKEASSISTKFGNALLSLGFKRGDVLAFFLPNCPEYITSLTGAIGAGGVATTVNPSYTATEVARQLELSNATMIITKLSMLNTAKEAIEKTKKSIRIILLDEKHPSTISLQFSTISYKEIIEHAEAFWSKDIVGHTDNDDVCLLPYSSGTTGLPKGVMLTAQNMISNMCQLVYAKEMDFISETTDTFQPKTICVLPMFHAFGLGVTALPTIHAGGQLITLPNFEPAAFLGAMEKHQPTFMHLVPPLVGFCANSPQVESTHLKSVEYIMVGAAPVGETLIEAFKKKAPHVHFREGYGMTELSPVTTMTIVSMFKAGSCGVLLPNTEAKVVNLTRDEALGPNETGELCFRGPQVMKGYLNNEKATEETIKSGWLYSGDIAFYDELGRFYIVDRLKELIKVKGFQVPPAELEDLIRAHPMAADVAVIGIPDKLKGEVPRGYVVLKPNVNDSADICKSSINDYVDQHVAEYKKLVGGIEFVDSIPKSASGKILRKDLKTKFFLNTPTFGE